MEYTLYINATLLKLIIELMPVAPRFELPELSKEQLSVLETLKMHNVITSAVAGAGKTTLALQLVRAFSGSKFLVVTYNRALSQDCNQKIRALALGDRVKCFTYHALMAKVCKQKCFNDSMFLDLLHHHLQNVSGLDFQFDALVVDEMQDQRLHHYQFLTALLCQLKKTDCRFLFVGDNNQLLYDFYKQNPADTRYLGLAATLFSRFTTVGFKKVALSVSFRTTPKIAAFVNHTCSGSNMTSGNTTAPNEPVRYVVCNLYSYRTVHYLYHLIREHGQENVLFVSNTVTKSRSLKFIINALRGKGISFFVSRNDYPPATSAVLKNGKVSVETYCGVKGLERKCVVVFGLGYTKFRSGQRDNKQNQVYVALTRSCGGLLYVMHSCDFGAPWLTGLDPGTVEVIEHRTLPLAKNSAATSQTRNGPLLPTIELQDALKFIDISVLSEAVRLVDVKELAPAIKTAFRSVIRFGNRFEDVRVIVSIALPMMLEFEHTGKCKQIERLLQPGSEPQENRRLSGEKVAFSKTVDTQKRLPAGILARTKSLYEAPNKRIEHWLELANAVLSYQNFSHLLTQIHRYDWFAGVDLEALRYLVRSAQPTVFNEPSVYFSSKYTVKYAVDMVGADRSLFSFEFASATSVEQVLTAALQLAMSGGRYTRAYVYNIENRQLLELTCFRKEDLIRSIMNCNIKESGCIGSGSKDPAQGGCLDEVAFLAVASSHLH